MGAADGSRSRGSGAGALLGGGERIAGALVLVPILVPVLVSIFLLFFIFFPQLSWETSNLKNYYFSKA